MKQVVQTLKRGKCRVLDVPPPLASPGHVVIANRVSLISTGTEKAAVELARAPLWQKARQHPDQVRRVLEKVRNEGLWTTLHQVRERLDDTMALGYSSVGEILACGDGVRDLRPGDRVASNGPHAGVVAVPRNLCAQIPEAVPFEVATFTVLGAIALQGLRLARCEVGSTLFVVGLGLIGQLTVALAKAGGMRVLATDVDGARCQLATRIGASVADPELTRTRVEELTRGIGADGVIIAAATKSDGPVRLAGEAVRKKGRVVCVGSVGMNLPRRAYYFKEAEFVVSCSYGPGRYDPEYEDRGHDYPVGYVRWTEQRNMETVLQLMEAGTLDPTPLISHRFGIEEAGRAYEIVEDGAVASMGILLEYGSGSDSPKRISLTGAARKVHSGALRVGVIGSGNFARNVIIPCLSRLPDVVLQGICSEHGLSAVHTGNKRGFHYAASSDTEILDDPEIDAVFILTRHGAHADQVVRALRAGKHVFVEKPLALTVEEVIGIEDALASAKRGESTPILMVGFNRRFAPLAIEAKQHFRNAGGPLSVSVRFNAGSVAKNHWTQDLREGGGRLVGEACHAIDLATFITGAPPTRVFADCIGGTDAPEICDDQAFLTLRHADGSVSNIAYLAGGDSSFPKERVEIFGSGRVAVIDDLRRLTLSSAGRIRTTGRRQLKGHQEELRAFVAAITSGGNWPIPWKQLRAVSLAVVLANQSLREGFPLEIPLEGRS